MAVAAALGAPTAAKPTPTGKAAAPLLKHYQEEIDSLTKRARHAEASFLELYQELYEVCVRVCINRSRSLRCCLFSQQRVPFVLLQLLRSPGAGQAAVLPFHSQFIPHATHLPPPPQAPDPAAALSAALESEAHTAQLEAQASAGSRTVGSAAVARNQQLTGCSWRFAWPLCSPGHAVCIQLFPASSSDLAYVSCDCHFFFLE